MLFEVEAPEAGTVLGFVADEGQEVEVGHTLAWLGEPGEAIPDDADRGGGDVRAAPVVRRLAAELGVDLASLADPARAGGS